MAHYRKIDTRIWNDEKFNSLSPNGQLAFFFILTHPNLTSLGAMRGTRIGLSAELPKVFPKAFDEVFDKGFVKDNPKANFILIPNFLKYNKPENPNVITNWGKCFDLLPECDLKDQLLIRVKDSIKDYGKAFQKAFVKAFGKGYPKTGTGTGAVTG